jgi:hypothetical protein
MTAIDAMKDIERPEFAVRVGLANSFRTFLRNIGSEPAVTRLLSLAKSRDVASEILRRIFSLSKLPVDIRYSHRFDTPLATYLWVLSRTFPDLARAGAETTGNLPRTWWTEQLCGYILGEWSQRPIGVTGIGVVHTPGDLANVNTTNVATSTSTFFPSSQVDFVPAKQSIEVTSSGDASSVVQHTETDEDVSSLRYTTGTVSAHLVKE